MTHIQDSNFSSVGQHNDNEIMLLKRKLVQTHQKLLKQLEFTRDLEQQLLQVSHKNQQLTNENHNLKRRLQSQISQQKQGNDKKLVLKILSQKEYENKNNLLRSDLEAMRTKIITEMLEKTKAQQSLHAKTQIIQELQSNNKMLLSELKKRQLQFNNKFEDYDQIKAKYEEVLSDAFKYKEMHDQLKRKQTFYLSSINDLETFLKIQKQKSITIVNQRKSFEKQMVQLKNKCQDNGIILSDLNYQIQTEQKQNGRLKGIIQKLNIEINQLTIKLKVKQRQIQEQRLKPQRQLLKQKQNYQQSKQLVQKLQHQQRQKQKTSHKKVRQYSPLRSVSPLKNNFIESPKKVDYLDNISQMSKLQNILLQSNQTKNKLLTQIDRIDGIKVKTNQLYLKRKYCQQQLQSVQELIAETKSKLKVLNAI